MNSIKKKVAVVFFAAAGLFAFGIQDSYGTLPECDVQKPLSECPGIATPCCEDSNGNVQGRFIF